MRPARGDQSARRAQGPPRSSAPPRRRRPWRRPRRRRRRAHASPMDLATASPLLAFTSTMAMLWPAAASLRAVASPMPLAPPVTTATPGLDMLVSSCAVGVVSRAAGRRTVHPNGPQVRPMWLEEPSYRTACTPASWRTGGRRRHDGSHFVMHGEAWLSRGAGRCGRIPLLLIAIAIDGDIAP